MTGSPRPLVFKVFFASLVIVSLGSIVLGIINGEHLSDHFVAFITFTVLFAVAERTDLSYYDGKVRWGISTSEALLVPMFLLLSPTQIVIAAVVAMASLIDEWREDPAKHGFNVAEYGCSALLATAIWTHLEHPGTAFGVRDAGAALIAATTFMLATQFFVGVGIQLTGLGRIRDAFGGVRSTVGLGLIGSLVLGLFAAAAFAEATWMIALYPIALAALYFGYRAVARQASERTRIERLHEATRSLSTSSDLPKALEGFLVAVADVLSTVGARSIVRTRRGLVSSTVYAGDVVETMTPVEGSGVESFLHYVRETRRPLLFGPDHEPVPDALRTSGGHNFLAVPVMEDDDVSGLLIVSDRVGANEFEADDIKLLEALASDLSLTLQSYRLFEEIVEERERFQLLVESVSDYAIYMLDQQGHVVSWNSGAEKILGYEADDILGRHHSTFYPPDSHGSSQEELSQALARGHVETEGKRVRRDGSLIVANEIIAPMRAADGSLNGFAKVTRDITERVRVQAEKEVLRSQLHQAQRLESVGQLAGGVAHDFNNLLSVITNATTFAMEALPKGSEITEDLRDVKNAAKRATELTRQLLIFSRRDLYKPQALNLNDLIRQALKLLTRALGERVAIRAQLDDSIGMVKADPGQLEQVLMNLAINARDAMPGGGTLTIETSPLIIDAAMSRQYVDLSSGPHVRVSITDTGKGMDPAVLQKAFDPFFTTKPKGSGTGLGLATVYGIVKGAEGHINVMSTEGLGTTFEIVLPVASVVDVDQDPVVTIEPMQPQSNGETIFLVEDDDAVRSITQRVLQRQGYFVIEAPGSKEALTMFPAIKESVNLLLTDIVMPDMTGVELAERVRRLMPDLKVIYMSGYSSGVFSSGGVELEGELLQKPFEKDELLIMVRKVLDSSSDSVGGS